MVVKHHQNRHKIHRRCTFISSSHNWKYFCEPTFVYVHIGQDGIIVLNLTLSFRTYGSESPLKVKFYILNFIYKINVLYFHYCIYNNIKMVINGLKSIKTNIFLNQTFLFFSYFLLFFSYLSHMNNYCSI